MTAETLRYTAPPSASVDLVRWVEQLTAASTIARQLCNTEFVPPHFRGKVEAATAAVLYGATLGMDPLASWQAIYVISGRVGMYAKSMVAVVMAAGHSVWVESQSDKSVTVCALRKGAPPEQTARCTWDPQRAMTAGLYTNSKYKTNPQQMFYARAASEACRQIAPDALHGMAYSVEELEDMPPLAVDATVGEPVTAVDILGGPVETAAEGPQVVMVQQDQHKRMHRLWGLLGYSDSDQDRKTRLQVTSRIVGREVESSKDLTFTEANTMIKELTVKVEEAAARKAAQPSQQPEPEPAYGSGPADDAVVVGYIEADEVDGWPPVAGTDGGA
jgi:hypothetical protein